VSWLIVAGVMSFFGMNSAYALVPQVVTYLNVNNGNSIVAGLTGSVSINFSGGQPVTFTTTTPEYCTVSKSGVITGVSAGTCAITVTTPATPPSTQYGVIFYSAAEANITVSIIVLSQVVTYSNANNGLSLIVGKTGGANVDFSGHGSVPSLYTTSTPSICSVATPSSPGLSATVTGISPGSCVIDVSNPGNISYLPVSASLTIPVIDDPRKQTLHLNVSSPLAVGNTIGLAAWSSSGLPVTVSTNTTNICSVSSDSVTGKSTGSCFISVQQPGDANFDPAPTISRTITVIPNLIDRPLTGNVDPLYKDPNNTDKCNCQASGSDKNAPGIYTDPSRASRDPVDMGTGYYFDTIKLLNVAAPGAPLQVNLSYNSGNTVADNFGFGWSHSFQYHLSQASFVTETASNGSVYQSAIFNIIWPDRHVSAYKSINDANGVATGKFSNYAAHASDVFIQNIDGTFSLTDRRQKIYTFDATGKLVKTVDRYGYSRSFSYLANGNLDKVIDNLSGRFIQFGYDAQNNIISADIAGGGSAIFTYDSNGNLKAATDALGNSTNFTYDANHRLLTKANALGEVTVSNTYDAAGKVSAQDDGQSTTPLEEFAYSIDQTTGLPYTTYLSRSGGTLRQDYDNTGNLLSATDPLGGTETHTYDPTTGVRTGYFDPLGHKSAFTYDASGYVTQRVNAQDGVTSYSYDSEHNITGIVDEAGNITSFTYGANHQLLTKSNAAGGVTTYTYNDQGLLATVTFPVGGTTSYTYDLLGNLLSVVDAIGLKTSFTYDDAGRVLSRSNDLGNSWTWTYDLKGQLLTSTNALKQTTTYTYDALGRLATKTVPNGGVTSYAYDIHDNLIKVTDALNKATSFSYDAEDHLIGITDALGNVTTFTRDVKGRVTAKTNALGNKKTFVFDATDAVISKIDAMSNQTDLAYDSLLRLATVTYPGKNTISTAYDALSQVTSRTDAKEKVTAFAYDALGNLVTTTNAMGNSAKQVFDQNGNRTSFTDAMGNTTSYVVDAANRVTSITTSDGGVTSYTYNKLNMVATATNGRGQIATYTYNEIGQLITLVDAASTVTLTYDANGNVLTIGDSVGTSTYTYDSLSRVTSFKDVFGNTVSYAYDAVGNLTKLTYPGDKSVIYTYDAANRMATVTDWSGLVTSYNYDASGRSTGISRANGTHGAYSYDTNGQITSIAETTVGNANLYAIAYSYDANGNVASEVTTPAAAPVVPAILSMTYGADNRLTAVDGHAVAYDEDGNMTSGPVGGATTTYNFDARSRLTGVGASSFVYNAQGDRVSAANAGSVTRYVIDPITSLPRVLMETDAAGSPIAYYVYGLGLISRESATGTYQTYHYDLRGSTVKLANSSGVVTDRYGYGPYGELTSSTGTTANPFRYNGRDGVMTDPNGLYYMRARYYLPEVKRFVNRDTLMGSLDQTLTLNRFAYVNGNPVGFVDPSGNVDEKISGIDFHVGFNVKENIRGINFDVKVMEERDFWYILSDTASEFMEDMRNSLNSGIKTGKNLISATKKAMKGTFAKDLDPCEKEALKDGVKIGAENTIGKVPISSAPSAVVPNMVDTLYNHHMAAKATTAIDKNEEELATEQRIQK
jgi:RHS repeat-associated protein